MFRYLIVLAAVFMLTPSTAGAVDARDYVPPSFSDTWVEKGRPAIFDRDNLFEHINGEAEIYFPYGFEKLESTTYESRFNPDLWIVADVYKMGSGLDAFGIYSNYRRPDYSFIKIGAEGFVSPSQLLFYQDRYFVRVQVTGEAETEKRHLLDCARDISGRLPENHRPPPELEVFNVPGIVPKSERYVAKSLLGYDFFRRGIVADAGGGGVILQVFMMSAESPETARRTLERYAAFVKSEGITARITQVGGRAVLESADPLYGKIYAEQSGRYLLGAVRVQNVPAAKILIDKMRAKLENAGF